MQRPQWVHSGSGRNQCPYRQQEYLFHTRAMNRAMRGCPTQTPLGKSSNLSGSIIFENQIFLLMRVKTLLVSIRLHLDRCGRPCFLLAADRGKCPHHNHGHLPRRRLRQLLQLFKVESHMRLLGFAGASQSIGPTRMGRGFSISCM